MILNVYVRRDVAFIEPKHFDKPNITYVLTSQYQKGRGIVP